MNARWPGRRGAVSVWLLTVALLAGFVAGMALSRPFEPARAAGRARAPQQPPTAPLPFPGAQEPATERTTPADGTAPAGQTGTEPIPPISTVTFETPAAMIMNFVRADRTSSFEQITSRLVASLATSEDPERRAQAAGWKMYRVAQPGPNNDAVYVWLFDPVVEDANYAVPQLLNESFPAEVQQLYETWNQSFGIGRMRLDLDPVVLVEERR